MIEKISGWRHILIICGVALLSGAFPCAADEIVLKNGDRLSGVILLIENDVLKLKTDYTQPIEIKISAIHTINTSQPVDLHLKTGKSIKGNIQTDRDGRFSLLPLDDSVAVEFFWKDISAVNPPRIKWAGGISLAAGTQNGNTDSNSISAAVDVRKRRQNDRTTFRYIFNYGDEFEQMITRNHYGVAKYDYFFRTKLYGYLNAALLNDLFRDIKLRRTVGPGAGYQIWEDSKKSLDIEAGISYITENHYDAPYTDVWGARLAADFSYTFGRYLVFDDFFTFEPSLERHYHEYQLRNEAIMSLPLGAKWTARLAHIFEYDSDPPDAVKKTDNTTTFGLQYKF